MIGAWGLAAIGCWLFLLVTLGIAIKVGQFIEHMDARRAAALRARFPDWELPE